MTRVVLKRGNDQVVTLEKLRVTKTGVPLNDAEVKATLQDSRGQTVHGFQDCPMTYVAGSDGNYEWEIESATIMLPKGTAYELVVTAKQEGLDYRVVHPVSVVD